MPSTNSGADLMYNAKRAAITHVSVHDGDPTIAATGGAESSVNRVAYAFPAATNNGRRLQQDTDASVPLADGNGCTHVTFWNAETGGAMIHYIALPQRVQQAGAGQWNFIIDQAILNLV